VGLLDFARVFTISGCCVHNQRCLLDKYILIPDYDPSNRQLVLYQYYRYTMGAGYDLYFWRRKLGIRLD